MTDRDHLQAVPSPGTEVDLVVHDLAFPDLPGSMWDLPDVIEGELRELHAGLVDGLRRDARHFATTTLAAMQIERIAYYYVRIRYHELFNNWRSPSERLSMYKLWRDLASDHQAMSVSKNLSPEELHRMVSQHSAKIIVSVLKNLPNDQSKPLYRRFAAELDAASTQTQERNG